MNEWLYMQCENCGCVWRIINELEIYLEGLRRWSRYDDGVSHEGFHAGIMLSSSTNKHLSPFPLSICLLNYTHFNPCILHLISSPIDLIHTCMHACCCLPGSQHPLPFPHLLFNLILHAQIILSIMHAYYCGLPSLFFFSQELHICSHWHAGPYIPYVSHYSTQLGSSWDLRGGVMQIDHVHGTAWPACMQSGQVYVGLLHYISRKLDQLVGGIYAMLTCMSIFFAAPIYACMLAI